MSKFTFLFFSWLLIVDANNKTVNPSVDVVSTMDDLSMFADGSAAAVYASHVLERASYGQPRSARWPDNRPDSSNSKAAHNSDNQNVPGYQKSLGIFAGSEVAIALAEWRRVLAPSGVLFIAVPDLPTLFRLYVDHDKMNARIDISRMILGGQTDKYDIHLAGFDVNLLSQVHLRVASFSHTHILHR